MAALRDDGTRTSVLRLLGRAVCFCCYILASASLEYLYQKAREHPANAKILTTKCTSSGLLRSLCAGLNESPVEIAYESRF
jgi:hypothetical protein